MASSIETTSTTTTLKNNGNTYATVDTNDDVTITNDLAVSGDVGIGTSSPIAKLTTDSGDIAISSTQASDNGDLGEFQFWNRTNAGSGSGTSFVNDVAAIKGQMEGTGNNSGGSLHFYTKADGETKNEVMRLEGTGSLKAQSPASTTGLQPFTIDWMNENNAGIMASIGCDRTASSAAPADLVFRTSTSVDSGAISEKMRITSAGNVGINKTAPVTKLHIEGGGTSLPATTGTTPSAGTTLRIRPGNNAILDIGGNSTSGAWLQSYDQTGMQTEYPLLLNPNGGNVGIGIAAPLAKNHTFGAGTAVVVSGSDGRAEAIIEGANIPLTSSYGNLNIISNTSQAADTGGQIAFGGKHTDSNNAYGTWAVIKGAKENATSANIASYLAFSTRANGGGNTEKLRITSAGNVGIGIAAPTGKFAVSDGTTTGEINPTGGICWIGTRSNHDVAFKVNASEAMRIAANGKVGIGISAAVYPLDVYGVIAIKDGESLTWKGNAQHSASIVGSGSAARVSIWTSQNERMRIDSGGSVLIGGTTAEPGRGNTTTGITLNPNGRIFQNASGSFSSLGRNDDGAIYVFTRGGTDVGNISVTSSATSYNTSSDYRLKENVEYDWDATTRLKQLKPARFNFLADPDNTVDGFIAHEAQEVVPESVTGFKDEMADAVLYVKGDELPKGKKIGDIKEKRKPVMQGIDQAKLVPLLVKTVQEQQTVIESLEARIAKLEENK